jgi:two-component system, chemotaxis family, sensor kinase CheA
MVGTMMIEDDELRNLYKLSGEERLQQFETGLLRLEEQPGDLATIALLLQETHRLKGDSRAVGVESVAAIVEAIEKILKRLQSQEMHLNPEINAGLYQALTAIAELIHAATTGEPNTIEVAQILAQLSGAISTNRNSEAIANLQFNLVADEELCEIYRITCEERLQKLEAGLVKLLNQPDSAVLSELKYQIHSLKGDSRAVGIEAIATIAQQLEQILKHVQLEKNAVEAVSDHLFTGIDAIAQLVHAAVTGEPSLVDPDQVLEHLLALDTLLEVSSLDSQAVEITLDHQPVSNVTELEQFESVPVSSLMIEDAVLRTVFKTSSEERLQKLEAGLAQLEERPSDPAVLAELLREAHSLKGDANSVGSESIGTLTHKIEEVFEQIQRQEVVVTPAVSNSLYVGLDAIGHFVQEAVTGQFSQMNVEQVLDELDKIVPVAATHETKVQETVPPEILIPAIHKVDEPYQIDTIRVQTQDLDVLMARTDELTATRIQIAQTTSQIEQLTSLWEKWKSTKNREQYPHEASSSREACEEDLEALINRLRASTQANTTKLEGVAEALREKVYDLRLLPLSTVFQLFPRTVRELARQQSKAVELVIEGEETTADKRILESVKDALTHLIRNAVDHGIETSEEREQLGKPPVGKIWLRAYQSANSIVIEVADDGRGLDLEQIKQTAIKRKLYRKEELERLSPNQIRALILSPGFSTRTFITELSGRGVGLDVVKTQVERLKGALQLESTLDQGTTFRLQFRTTLTTINVVFVEVQGIVHALPFEFLQTTLPISPEQVTVTRSQNTIFWNDQPIAVANLLDVLELSKSLAYAVAAKPRLQSRDRRPCLIFQVGEEKAGFLVDRLLNTEEVILKSQSRLLKRVRNVLGATTLASGEVCMILNPVELIKSIQQKPFDPITPIAKAVQRKPVVLLVEDSMPVQTQERRLLEGVGYEVVVANDGLEGYRALQSGQFDAIVSDVEMPNLDGLSLTAKIRQQPEYAELPIILVTTLSSDEDRKRGADAGANAYIAKGKFNQEVLLETLARLI